MSPIKREFSGFAKPLQVVGFIATKKGDPERGPMVRLRPEDALIRLLMPGELVRVISDRRSELAELQVDEAVPKGGAVLRDVAGAAVTEIIRVVRLDLEAAASGLMSSMDDNTEGSDTPNDDDANASAVADATAIGNDIKVTRATLAVHGGRTHGTPGTPVATPLIQSVNFLTAPGSHDELLYTRYGNTPNALVLQNRLALLEGSEAALVLSSGMGATACTMMALLRPGDHLLASSWLYGGSRHLFEQELTAQGIEVTFVDPTETRGWRRSVRHNTRVLFLESPVNPTTRVLDLRPVSALARELGLALVVDSTFASPINFRALEHGADVVIHSATKYLNGHHDVLAGVVCGSAAVIEEVRHKMIVWGQAADPFAAWLLERGLKTLDVRVRRQNESAMRVAQWASEFPAFARVHYPGLPSHPDHEIAKETLDGFGGMMAVELARGADATQDMLERLQLFLHAPSLGGVESLVSEPRYTSHEHLSSDERAAIGIPDGFLRLSIGLEDPADLIADLAQATE